MERSEQEIQDQIDKAAGVAFGEHPSRWPGMSYEQGVEHALSWALGERDEAPMEDED